MKKRLLAYPLLAVLAACSSKTDPTEKNFGAAIEAYLAKKGRLCLNDETWPVELDEMSKKLGASFGGSSRQARLNALVAEGLAKATTLEKPQLSFSGKPLGRSIQVTRYELTDKGRTFFRATTSTFSKPREGEVRGELCYANRALDKVLKWEGPMRLGDYQEAVVKYTYKIEGLADWAMAPSVQVAFPQIKQWLDGAGSKQQSHGVRLTSEGWEANGIDTE